LDRKPKFFLFIFIAIFKIIFNIIEFNLDKIKISVKIIQDEQNTSEYSKQKL